MKFITVYYGLEHKPVHLNVDHIVTLVPEDEGTAIIFNNIRNMTVPLTVQTILDMIKEAPEL